MADDISQVTVQYKCQLVEVPFLCALSYGCMWLVMTILYLFCDKERFVQFMKDFTTFLHTYNASIHLSQAKISHLV